MELDPTHAQVAEQARSKICELIARGKVLVAEIVIGEPDATPPTE